MDHAEPKDHCKCTNVAWGKIIAGAAIAAGAVLLGVTSLLTSPVMGTSIGAQILRVLTQPIVKNLAGAALIGGGIAHFMGGGNEVCHDHIDELATHNRETFVMAEDIRKMEAKKLILAAAAGNPEAQAMMAQMQGRAC